MNLQEIREIAITALMVQVSRQLGDLKEKVEKGKKEMKSDKMSAIGKSDLVDKAAACSVANLLSRTLPDTCEEIKKLEVARAGYLTYLSQSTETISLWSLVKVAYENPDTGGDFKMYYLIAPIMPGATAFETADIKVHVISPETQIGKQMIGEELGAEIECKLGNTPHLGTIIGFA